MKRRPNRRYDMQTRYLRARRRNMVDARPGPHDCVMVLDGLKPTFNIGKIFRSADALGAREIHLVGIDHFDPVPAKGSVRWVPFFLHDEFSGCYKVLTEQGYEFFALDPGGDSRLDESCLPRKSAFILGHEEFGFSFDFAEFSAINKILIPQWGHVQSLNVSVAAAIVLYEYIRQNGAALTDAARGDAA